MTQNDVSKQRARTLGFTRKQGKKFAYYTCVKCGQKIHIVNLSSAEEVEEKMSKHRSWCEKQNW